MKPLAPALTLAALLVPLVAVAALDVTDTNFATLTCGTNTACLITVPSTITATIVGDSENWAVETATPNAVTVKPTDAHLRTNLILLTAGETYFIDLVSPAETDRATGTPRITFEARRPSPPPPMVQTLATPPSSPPPGVASSPSPSSSTPQPVSIAYRWTTQKRPRITAVYDDGSRTFIRVRGDEAPALYALGTEGPEAVNYVVTPGPGAHEMTYAADRVSAKWLLTLGGKGRRATNLVIEQVAFRTRQTPAALTTPAAPTADSAPAASEN